MRTRSQASKGKTTPPSPSLATPKKPKKKAPSEVVKKRTSGKKAKSPPKKTLRGTSKKSDVSLERLNEKLVKKVTSPAKKVSKSLISSPPPARKRRTRLNEELVKKSTSPAKSLISSPPPARKPRTRLNEELVKKATSPAKSLISSPPPARKPRTRGSQRKEEECLIRPPPSKKPIYANAAKSWGDSSGSAIPSRDIYDVVVESDESYPPPKAKRRKRQPRAPKKTLPSLKHITRRPPLKEKLLNPKITSSSPINNKTLRESFDASAPPAGNEDIRDEFSNDEHMFSPNCFQQPARGAIDKSVRMSTFKKGAFSSSTPDRNEGLFSPQQPQKQGPPPLMQKMSTPKPPSSIKEQFRNCFGFDESSEEELFGEISTSAIASHKDISLDNAAKPTRLDPSLFKKPQVLPRPPKRKSSSAVLLPKPRDASMNSTLLFEDLEDDEKKLSTTKQKSMTSFIKPIVSEVRLDSESDNEEEERSSNKGRSTPAASLQSRKRKRNSNSSSSPSPMHRTKEEDEELHNWENNKSLEFSKVNEFDLTFSC